MNSYKNFLTISGLWLSFALLLNIGRLFMAEVPSYIYMNWNVFLALVPVLCVYLFEKTQHIKILSIFFFLAWLLFLPNAPYIVTDFIHLRNVGSEAMLWYDGMMIFAYTIIGVHAFAFSLLRVVQKVKRKIFFVFAISLLSSFGIYLGRYIRWNTWDIVTRPGELFTSSIKVFGEIMHTPIISLTLLVFTLFMMVSYYSYCHFISLKK